MGQQPQQRRSGPIERESSSAGTYPYRNGSKEKDDWEEPERSRRDGRYVQKKDAFRLFIFTFSLFIYRRSDGRYSETGSVVSSAVLNHYASLHRRPVNRVSQVNGIQLFKKKYQLSLFRIQIFYRPHYVWLKSSIILVWKLSNTLYDAELMN